ncbi:hypothetical protein LTR66_003243 [Elasticomyces elasticus]|nr:hypothetical protein LTR28_007803 [Elasticomyces elasticus]KAK4997306.1 hypothetical protein LTR66_003243 [Elasticomyces elasticus]
MSSPLPPNAHVSTHPCLRAKLSQLRSHATNARETKLLIHEIATIVGCEALAHGLKSIDGAVDKSPLGYEFTAETISPSHISLVPILRSGLGMVDGILSPVHLAIPTNPLYIPTTRTQFSTRSYHTILLKTRAMLSTDTKNPPALQSLLPSPVPVHHLGLYRERSTLQPVEYYNNLPYHRPSQNASSSTPSTPTTSASDLAILIDPVIATGATACAGIATLRDWGVKRIIVCSVIASEDGLRRAAEEWSEGVEVWVGGVDKETDDRGMIKPGLGDVGDRLFLTIGK